jgi:predicted Fe-Mo cluster-binding NifX family protein
MWKPSEQDNIFDILKKINETTIKSTDYVKFDTIEDLEKWARMGDCWKDVAEFFEEVGTNWDEIKGKEFQIVNNRLFVKESKTNEAEKTSPPVPQTMKAQEEPVINAEDHSMEDISKDDKEKKDKEKEKAAKEVGTKNMQKIEDKDIEQKQPKKESRQQLHLCNKCFKTFRSNESICTFCKSNEVEKIVVEKEVQKVRQDFVDKCVKVFKAPGGTVQQKIAYMKTKGATDDEITQALDTASGGEVVKSALENETKVQESTYNVRFGDKHSEIVKDAISKVDAMAKAKAAYPVSRYNDKPIAITNVFKLEGGATKTGLVDYVITFDDGTSIKVSAKSPADAMDIVKTKGLKKNVVSTTPVEESVEIKEETKKSLLYIGVCVNRFDKDCIVFVYKGNKAEIVAVDGEGYPSAREEAVEKGRTIAKTLGVAFKLGVEESIKKIVSEMGIPEIIDTKELKVNETVEELVGESDIDVDDQITLRWALEKDIIPKQWPAKEVMFDELAKAGQVGANVETEVDIYVDYLKYVLLPRAKEAYSKQAVKEGVFDDAKKTVETASIKELENALEVTDEMIKQGANKSAWETIRSILQKGVSDKKKSEPAVVKEGEADIVGSTKGVYEVKFTDIAGEMETIRLFAFDEADATITVKKDAKVKEVLSVKKIGEGKVPADSDKEDVKIKKLMEQPEKDGYTVVAKGLVDKVEADRIATEKKGMVVVDAEDPKKWQVIVKEA